MSETNTNNEERKRALEEKILIWEGIVEEERQAVVQAEAEVDEGRLIVDQAQQALEACESRK